MKRFIEHIEYNTTYDAGKVVKIGDNYAIGYEMKGAQDMFSVGQPVYDKDCNLMGWLGIGLYESLNYSISEDLRVPCEYWQICLPTKYCEEGKNVFTYYQMLEMKEGDHNV